MAKTYNRKEILVAVIAENPDLSLNDYVQITRKPERTIAYWMAGERAPDDMALFQIETALKISKRKIPRELTRLSNSLLGFARHWGEKNKTDNSNYEYIGEMLSKKPVKQLFIFKGDLLNVSQISKITGISKGTIYARVKSAKSTNGDDVTLIATTKGGIGRPTK